MPAGLSTAAPVAVAAPGTLATRIAAATAETPNAKVIDALTVGSTAGAGSTTGVDATPAPTPDAASLFALHGPTGHDGALHLDVGASPFDGAPTPTPHLHEGFDDAMGARMSWLADQKIGHAHIKITPGELGPIEVRLQLDGDKVQASFSSAHADVRQALEQSLPRLRELLGQQGLQLTHADVGGQPQRRQMDGRSGEATSPDSSALDAITPVGIPKGLLRGRGILDAYA